MCTLFFWVKTYSLFISGFAKSRKKWSLAAATD